MFRIVLNHMQRRMLSSWTIRNSNLLFNKLVCKPKFMPCSVGVTKMPKDHNETDDEYDCRMIALFNRPDIDGWQLRQGLNELAGMDAVPDPCVIIAAFLACRRINDYALTTRILEMVKSKCGNNVDKLYPYMMGQLEDSMKELGIESLEDLGYDRPELWVKSVFDMHD